MPNEDRLDPKIMRELEASGLPTVPTLALSGLPRSIWNRLMAPAEASQEVMKSGEIGAASVTPQQTLEMGSALIPGYGRALGKTGEIGVSGGRPTVGGTRGSRFLSPTSKELERFWNRVNAYKSIGRIAWAEGVSQHTVRERMQSPFWAKPPDFKPMSPQVVAQMDGLTAVTPRTPTPADVDRFWAVIGRYQRLRNWRTPVKQILGISDGVLDRRLNDPRWQRNAAKPKPDDELGAASFGGDPRVFPRPYDRSRRDEDDQRDRLYEKYPPPNKPKDVPPPSVPGGKISGMSIDEFYGPIMPLADLKGAEVNRRWEGVEPDYEQLRPMVEQFGGAKIEDALTPRESDNVEIDRPPPDYTNPVPGPP